MHRDFALLRFISVDLNVTALPQINTTEMETLKLLQLAAKFVSLYHQTQSCSTQAREAQRRNSSIVSQ